MADTLEQTGLQENLLGTVTFHEPDGGRSAGAYAQQIVEYVAVRGQAPQSVTMHPDTERALGLSKRTVDPSLTTSVPLVITLPDYDRVTITLFF